jgi:uncharacterized protein (TIGR03435 family)
MTFEPLLDQPALQAIGHALLQFLWQGTLLAAVLQTGNLLTRSSEPRLRYALACLVMLVMPAVFGVTIFRALPSSAPAPVHSNLPETARPAPAIVSGVTLMEEFRWTARHETTLFGWTAALWLSGVLALSMYTACGWMRLRTLRRCATLAPAMHATLAGLGRRLGVTRPVRLYLSVAVDVPAVIGYLRPYILLPISAVTGLDEFQLAAVLAHELAHVRRHDYLVNMLQSAVETVLFFHPAVWWISRRIREERELCCDDLAVGVCGDPVVYARALVQLEELRGTIPEGALAASGGDLLARIRRLLGEPSVARVSVPAGAGIAALLILGTSIACATAFAQAEPAFEAASIKAAPPVDPAGFKVGCSAGPGTPRPLVFNCDNVDLAMLIMRAYDLKRYQLPWARRDDPQYNLMARVAKGATREQANRMLQSLLAERFQLRGHMEKQEVSVYQLREAEGGVKMKKSPPEGTASAVGKDDNGFAIPPRQPGAFHENRRKNGLTRVDYFNATMDELAKRLSDQLDRPVVNGTELQGEYDVSMTFASPLAPLLSPDSAASDPVGPSIFAAVKKYLGLKLESGKGMIDVFVVDHVAKAPSGN